MDNEIFMPLGEIIRIVGLLYLENVTLRQQITMLQAQIEELRQPEKQAEGIRETT